MSTTTSTYPTPASAQIARPKSRIGDRERHDRSESLVNLMGGPDAAPSLSLFGSSEPALVDHLFNGRP